MTLWLFAFVWTVTIELPIYTALLGRRFRTWWGVVVMTFAINAVTHPALWFALPRSLPHFAAVGEALVIAVEAMLIAIVLARRTPLRIAIPRALVASALANAASYVGGLALFRLVG